MISLLGLEYNKTVSIFKDRIDSGRLKLKSKLLYGSSNAYMNDCWVSPSTLPSIDRKLSRTLSLIKKDAPEFSIRPAFKGNPRAHHNRVARHLLSRRNKSIPVGRTLGM